VNFEGTATVLISARRAGVRRFINASSSSIFGASACACVGETAEPEPLTAYSRTKHLAEWVVRAAHSSGFTTVNVRPATICGVSPRQRLDLLVNQLAADAVTRGCITVQGGDQRRPHVTMTDIVRFYRLMMTAPEEAVGGRTFNVAFETETVRETAERIQAIFGRDRVKLEYTAVKDARDYHVDGELIRRRFQFAPVSSIRQEVLELEQAIRSGRVDPQDARHYNLRGELPRRNAAANHIEEAAYEPLPEAQR
jgi:nucleoside-diphosphate-sugar epimerase